MRTNLKHQKTETPVIGALQQNNETPENTPKSLKNHAFFSLGQIGTVLALKKIFHPTSKFSNNGKRIQCKILRNNPS